MKPAVIIDALEKFAPRELQESWDNTGLQIGFPEGADCTGVLLCVDVTEEIIAEAVERGCNLVVSHHPLIFKGLKSLTGRTPAERAAISAIRSGVAVYSSHTALDSTRGGVSYAMARMLGAEVERTLSPAELKMYRLQVICPRDMAEDVRLALLDANAGVPLGSNADAGVASSDIEGYTLGTVDTASGSLDIPLTHRPLTRVETEIPAPRMGACASALELLREPVKYSFAEIEDRDKGLGLGVVARFPQPIGAADLLDRIKNVFSVPVVRANEALSAAVADSETKVSRIALCGGAGGEFLGAAKAAGAQVYITADVRYHDFADNRAGIGLADIGHFESESCAKDIFYHVLTEKFPNFAVYYSKSEKNPVHYL